jgi:large subunit ribosomal protein L19
MQVDQLFKTNKNILPDFGPGDTVKVNFKIKEGDRERIQAFIGVVIKKDNGNGPAANFTVRRIANGIGMERVFPSNSPLIDSLEIVRKGSVRRSRLYYLRGLQGRAARIKEKTTYRT